MAGKMRENKLRRYKHVQRDSQEDNKDRVREN